MGTQGYATTISVHALSADDDGWHLIESEDLPGLLLAGKNLPALEADIPAAIKLIYRLNYGMNVDVRRHIRPEAMQTQQLPVKMSDTESWVVVPLAA